MGVWHGLDKVYGNSWGSRQTVCVSVYLVGGWRSPVAGMPSALFSRRVEHSPFCGICHHRSSYRIRIRVAYSRYSTEI